MKTNYNYLLFSNKYFNNDIIYLILNRLNLEDKDKFIQCFPNFKHIISNEKEKFIDLYICKEIKELFGPKIYEFPILRFYSSFIKVDYIDNIDIFDIQNNKFMIGMDDYMRPFITIANLPQIIIIFQRYTGDYNTWTNAENYDNLKKYKNKNFLSFYSYFLDRGIKNGCYYKLQEFLIKLS